MSANDFFDSLMNQARDKDRTVPRSTVNSQASYNAVSGANDFFSSLKQQAKMMDATSFSGRPLKTLSSISNVSKSDSSTAKTPLLSGYDERADDYDGLFGTLRGVGESALAGIRSANEALAGWLSDVTPDAVKENISLVDADQNAARAAASAASGAVQERFGRTEESQEQGRERQQQATDYLTQRRNELDTGADVERLFEEAANSQEEAARIREYAVGDSGAFAQLLFDAGVGGVQMGYDALMNFLIPGSGLASAGLRGAGSGILEAQQSGASTLQQLAYGLGVGAVEAATEKISNLAWPLRRVFGGGAADRAVSSLINRLTSSTAGRAVLNLAANAAGEGFEEFVSSAANPVLRRVFDENALAEYGDPQMWADAAYDALVGATIGGVLGGAGQVIENRANRRASQNAAEAPTAGTATQTGVDTSTGVNPVEAGIDASVRLFNEGGGVIDTQAPNNTASVVEQLRAAIPQLQNNTPVAEVQGNELPQGNRLIDRLVAFAESIGNKVVRPGFGEVLFSRSRIRGSFAGHGYGNAKIETFAAVPAVIRDGVEIGHEQNWKGRGYDTYVFAAPINYRGDRTYLAAVVSRDAQSGRYYLHEVIDENGNIITPENKNQQESRSTRRATQEGTFDTRTTPAGDSPTPTGTADAGAPAFTASPENSPPVGTSSIPDSGQNVNGQEMTSDGRATPSSAFDTVSPPADASITVPGENASALADSMTDEQLALEQQRNAADVASINDVLNAAQRGQQFPQEIIDQLTEQLPGLMQEQQQLASVEQAKRVQRGEVSRNFGQPENHIDNRNPDSVKGNRVAAFSFDHPQLHGYFVQAARDLQGMADYAAEAERGRSNRGNRIDRERNRSAVEHAYSRELRNAMESGNLSKPQVLDACQRIIDNHGQENVLAAKRVELILDDMLTNGYTTADGVDVPPNMEYIAAKEQIAGARGAERAIQRYDDDLAIGALGMPYTDAELAEQEAERQRIREQYAALNQPAAQTSQNGEVSATDSTGAAPRGFSVGHAPRVVENQRRAIEGAIPPSQWTEPQRHEVMPERDSLHYAEQRAGVDFEGEMSDLRSKERWDAVDTDTAFTILQRLSQRAMETDSEADNQRLAEWQRLVDDRGSAAGSELQARKKWARLAETPELLYAEAVDLLNSPNVRGLSQEQKARVRQSVADAVTRFKSIDPNDTASMIDLIRSLSQTRRTTGLLNNETSRLMNTALNNVAQQESGAEFLRNIALSQIQNIAQDYRHVSITERMRTLRALNLLSKPATTLRNLIGNTVFDPLESISNNTGVVFDWLIGQLTGQRTMALDQSWFSETKRRGSVDALMRSIVEIGLDADAEGVENRYEQGGGRTFRMTGNFIERLLSTWEKINGYMLTSTDEFAKGGVRAEAQRGLEALQERNANVSDEYITSRADEIARQRTFQNDSVASDLMLRGRNALNAVHVGDIGLGDVMLPFARVPANVATQAINYSPAGIVNGVGQFARTMWNARRGTLTPEQQAQAATALGRGLTGTAGIAAFAALALKGILNVAGSDDQDEAALDTGEGMSGTQLNLSALMRLLNGESTEWRDGDQLMSIGFLEPINALMAMGSMVADSYTEDGTLDARDILNASLEGTIQSVLDLPAMSSIQELMNAWQYAAGEDTTERVVNAALSYAGSQLPGFVIPNLVAGIASGLDNTVRAPYLGETAEDDLVNQFLADIPGLRENVPARLDSWGNERTYSDSDVLNFLNSTILPGSVTQYHTNSVNQEIRRLGNFPQRSAPGDFSIDGEKITLTQEQKDAYQQAYGDAALSVLEPLMASSTYQSLSDEEKNKVIDSVYEYANAAAKQTIDNHYKLEGAAAKASEYDNPGEYFLFNEAWKVIEDSKGANTAAFEAVMQDYERMSTQKQNALMDALGEGTRFDDVVDAYEAGIDPERWYEAYDKHQELNENENLSANSAATEFAKWLDTESGFNANQRDVIEEQMRFWNMFPADTERYDALIDAGFTPEKADAVYDAVSALQPQQGKTQVSDLQRYEAIANMSGLTDAEKVQALTEYEGASSGDRQKFSTAYAYGISPELYVNMLEMQDEGVGDEDGNGRYKQDEAKLLIDTLMDSNSDMTTREAAILWAMLCPTSKTGNPYGNIYGSTSMEWDYAP